MSIADMTMTVTKNQYFHIHMHIAQAQFISWNEISSSHFISFEMHPKRLIIYDSLIIMK